jgi:hypothetical protein
MLVAEPGMGVCLPSDWTSHPAGEAAKQRLFPAEGAVSGCVCRRPKKRSKILSGGAICGFVWLICVVQS